MAGSLDDNPPKLFRDEYQYIILGQHVAKVYVARDCTMTRAEIAAQLRRVADYIDSIHDGECNCHE